MSVLTRIQSNHEPYQFANAISLWLHTMLNMEEDPGLHARDYRYETVATPCTCRLQVHFPVCLRAATPTRMWFAGLTPFGLPFG